MITITGIRGFCGALCLELGKKLNLPAAKKIEGRKRSIELRGSRILYIERTADLGGVELRRLGGSRDERESLTKMGLRDLKGNGAPHYSREMEG